MLQKLRDIVQIDCAKELAYSYSNYSIFSQWFYVFLVSFFQFSSHIFIIIQKYPIWMSDRGGCLELLPVTRKHSTLVNSELTFSGSISCFPKVVTVLARWISITSFISIRPLTYRRKTEHVWKWYWMTSAFLVISRNLKLFWRMDLQQPGHVCSPRSMGRTWWQRPYQEDGFWAEGQERLLRGLGPRSGEE